METTRTGAKRSRIDTLIRVGFACSMLLLALSCGAWLLQPVSRNYAPGDRFEAVGWEVEPRDTIVVAVSPNCGVCHDIGEAITRISRRPRPFRVLLLGHEHQELLQAFAVMYRIEADGVLSVPLGTLGVAKVPTVILVNGAGTVQSLIAGGPNIATAVDAIIEMATPGSIATQRSSSFSTSKKERRWL